MLPVFWRASARANLATIIRFIANDSPPAARRMRGLIEASVLPAAEHPYLYRSGRVPGRGLRCSGTENRVKDLEPTSSIDTASPD